MPERLPGRRKPTSPTGTERRSRRRHDSRQVAEDARQACPKAILATKSSVSPATVDEPDYPEAIDRRRDDVAQGGCAQHDTFAETLTSAPSPITRRS